MENEHKKNIFIIFAAALFFVIFSANICSSVRAFRYRKHLDTVRKQLTYAENTNRELELTIGECQSICRVLGDSIDRNVKSAREAVELIEQIRAQVYELENCIGSFSQLEYYQYWDNEFRDEELMN